MAMVTLCVVAESDGDRLRLQGVRTVTEDAEVQLQSTDPIRALRADRDLLAAAMVAAEPKELAGLSREYRAVLAELDRRGIGREESPSDDIAAQRAKRRAASGVKKAAGS